MKNKKSQHIIARHLIAAMVLFSTVITLISSGYQIYFNYREDVSGINKRLTEIHDAHLQSIVNGVWTANTNDLDRKLSSLTSLPDITYLEVRENGNVLASVGTPQTSKVISKQFPLHYYYKGKVIELGSLEVHATLTGAYDRAINQGITIIISNGIKTFLVVGFVFFLFYRLVTRHLEKISSYTSEIVITNQQEPLALSRSKRKKAQLDELDHVVSAINSMQARIFSSYTDLKESEKRFRLLAENINAVFWIGSTDWKQIYYVSPAYENVWGKSCNSLYKNPMSWFDSVHPEDRTIVEQEIQNRVQGIKSDLPDPYFPEYRIIRSDNEIRWISARAFPVFDNSGNIEHIVGLAEDITERKYSSMELTQSEERFRTLVESTVDGILSVNRDGSIIMANHSLHTMFGYDDGELIGRPVNVLVPGRLSEHDVNMHNYWQDPVKRAMKAAGTVSGKRKDGSTISVNISLTPLQTAEGQIVTAMVTDMTDIQRANAEREALQHQLMQSQKMDAIGQLTGGIAHDFNNLLAAILGYTGLAREVTELDGNEKIKDFLVSIETAGYRARDLIAQMLAFSRNEQHEMVEIDLGIIIKETTTMLLATIPSSVIINIDYDSDLPYVNGDSVQIHQVLMNLAVNARDAMQGKGTIDISTRHHKHHRGVCKSCHEKFSGELIELTISDTGGGIAPEILQKIFEPFFTTKKRGQGTGMGLSMVHGIIHSHNGHIDVKSSNNGTIFKLYLPVSIATPVREQQHKSDKNPESESNVSANGHILVVDDEEAIATMLNALLTSKGFRVTSMTSSKDALENFNHKPQQYDLVITDQTMPDLTGYELAKSMLTVRKNLPVIMLTGYSDTVNEAVAKELGITEFFYKPVEISQLVATVNRLLVNRKVA